MFIFRITTKFLFLFIAPIVKLGSEIIKNDKKPRSMNDLLIIKPYNKHTKSLITKFIIFLEINIVPGISTGFIYVYNIFSLINSCTFCTKLFEFSFKVLHTKDVQILNINLCVAT